MFSVQTVSEPIEIHVETVALELRNSLAEYGANCVWARWVFVAGASGGIGVGCGSGTVQPTSR